MVDNLIDILKKLWIGVFSVYEYKKITDENSKITHYDESLILKDIPCRLSIKYSQFLSNTTQTNTVNTINNEAKLFTFPDIIIKPGSKIVVIQNDVTRVYKNSGVPVVYPSHQEIIMQVFDKWA